LMIERACAHIRAVGASVELPFEGLASLLSFFLAFCLFLSHHEQRVNTANASIWVIGYFQKNTFLSLFNHLKRA
jgi:hypothetical protein